MTITLNQVYLTKDVFIFLSIFSRIGAMIMLFPALSASAIPSRIRLVFALAVTVILMPVIAPSFPALPGSPTSLAVFIVFEVLLGLMLGATVRLLMMSLQVAGTLVAFQSGLAFAQNFDPTQDSQGAIYATFLSILGMTLIFVLDLHHLMLGAMEHSYVLFPAGAEIPWESFSELVVKTVAGAFSLGVQMAAPFIVVGLLFYLGVGVLAKLMPQVQIFFVAMPANILLGLIIFLLVFSAMMMWFVDDFRNTLALFLP